MMKKVKRGWSFIFCLALIMCSCVAITPAASAADSGKILKINWDHIRTVGNQAGKNSSGKSSESCSCFALAYATTIMDGTPRQWWLYNQNKSKDQYNVNAHWDQSNSGFKSTIFPTTEQEMYERMKDAVEHGRPSVVLVRKTGGTPQHYITVVGYTGAGDKASDFLIIDPAGGATKGAPENMGGLNYTLKKRTQGNHHLGLYQFVFTDKSGIGTVGYPSDDPAPPNPVPPSISFSTSNLSVNVGASKTVSINFKGDGIKSIGGTINGTSICGASFGGADWDKGTTSLIVTGKKAGNATIAVNLKDENGKIFYSKSFSVTVVRPEEPIEAYLFDADIYYNLYGDLQRAFKKGDTAALKNHWEKFGKSEGRKASLFFDPIWYLNNNADLKRAYGSDYVQAYNHFVQYGFKEGRSGSPVFNARTYLSLHSDLKRAFNNDYLAAVNHFKKFGVNEQRRASDLLSIKAYLEKYPSVKAKYSDKLGYFIDYMRSSEYGKTLISYTKPVASASPKPTPVPTVTPAPAQTPGGSPSARPTATPSPGLEEPTVTPSPTPTPPSPSKTPVAGFQDVFEGDYFANAVKWAVENGITSGAGVGVFAPNSSCTRGQIVTFLWNAAGKPEPENNSSSFVDVKPSDYYYKAVIWAVENNITAGTSADTFSPDDSCSRNQAVTFLWRSEHEPLASSSSTFKDVQAGSYYADAVDWAVTNGITSGTSDTTFEPNQTCTRGQIVTFLFRTK